MSPDMQDLDATFSALSDPTRRAIIAKLAEGSATVNELAEPFDISLPAISRHLKVLESAELISREIEGQKRRCHLQPETLNAATEWIENTRAFWNERFDALETFLDETRKIKDR